MMMATLLKPVVLPPEEKKGKTLALWKFAVLSAPLSWVLGFNLVIFQFWAFLLAFRIFYKKSRRSEPVFFPSSFFYLTLLSVIYFFTILLHASGEPSRILAAFYNLSFWVMGAFLCFWASNDFTRPAIPSLLNSFYVLGMITAGLGLLGIVLWKSGHTTIVFPTPLARLLHSAPTSVLLETSFNVQFLTMDWFASLTSPRLNFFSPYPTATAGILMIVIAMMLQKAELENKIRSPFFLTLLMLNLMAFSLTLSRTSMITFALSLVAVFFLKKKRTFFWGLFFLLAAAATVPLIDKTLHFFLNLRQGSNNLRFELYRYTLSQLEGADWILGLGLKPREEFFVAPVGSHSMYVSLIYKSGICGFLTFVLFQINLFFRWLALKKAVIGNREDFLFWTACGWIFMMMALWMVTEDIDAPQMLAFLYFSVVGFFEGFRREVLSGTAR